MVEKSLAPPVIQEEIINREDLTSTMPVDLQQALTEAEKKEEEMTRKKP